MTMQKPEGKQVRSCLFCRAAARKNELLRFVRRGSEVLWDKDQNMPGRGAYVHMRLECVRRMVAPARWEKALRAAPIGAEALRTLMRDLLVLKLKAVEPDAGEGVVTAAKGSGKSLRRLRL